VFLLFFAAALHMPRWHFAVLFFCLSTILCAAALRFLPRRSFLCRWAVFLLLGCFFAAGLLLCRGAVLCAMAVCDLVPWLLCFVPWHGTMCCAIA